jgi:glutamate 5-kinase
VIVFLVGNNCKRIVIKLGTNLLVDDEGVKESTFKKINSYLKALDGNEVIIVTSGAVGFANFKAKTKFKHKTDMLRNAYASIGQPILMEYYRKNIDQEVGQILLTHNDISNRDSFLSIKKVFEIMFANKIIPIINENDAIKNKDNQFKDNDDLAMQLASSMHADLLLLLTNVSGVYTKDPREQDAELVAVMENHHLEKIKIGKKQGSMSTGGMDSKIGSALLSSRLGVQTIIANGNDENLITNMLKGVSSGTLFKVSDKINARQRWIRLTKSKGQIIVDNGAKEALRNNKSLLIAGMQKVKGTFVKDDVVEILCNEEIFAKSTIDYSSNELHIALDKSKEERKNIIKKNVVRHENIVFLN